MGLYSTNAASRAQNPEMWACSLEQARAIIDRANAKALQRAKAMADKFREITGLEPAERAANYAAAKAGTLRLVRGADGICRLFDKDTTLWEGVL